MSSSTPTLTYFDIRGLAELPRLLFALAEVKFTDERIAYTPGEGPDGEWGRRKDSTPYGQLPVLTVEGHQLAQSGAIIRYIAARYHLAGTNLIENAKVDGGYEAMLDLRRSYFQNKSDAEKTKKYWQEDLPKALSQIAKNVTGPFFLGEKITYADVAIYYTLWVLNTENSDAVQSALKANPKIQTIFTGVEKDPRIAQYLAARKVTQM